MYLRVSAFKTSPAGLDEGIAFLIRQDDVHRRPREGRGRCEHVVGASRSDEQRRAGEPAGADSIERGDRHRDRRRHRFEITDLQRASPNIQLTNYIRLISGYYDPQKADRTTQSIREIVPKLKAQPGFLAFSAGVNKMTGRGFTTTRWATPEQRATRPRSRAASRSRRRVGSTACR